MSKRTIAITLLLLLLSGAVAIHFLASSRGTDPSALTKVSLRLQWLDQAQFAGFYVAAHKGFYRKRGLDVSINSGGPDFNAMTLVSSGSDTFGIWTGDQIILGISKGLPIVPIGAIFDRSLAAFMVKTSSGIQSPKDFEGRTVGMYYGYDTETLYLELVRQFGIDRTKVRETPIQFDLTRFLSGDVDVWPSYVINQPLAAEQAGASVRLLTPKQFGISYYSDVLFVREDILRKSRQTVSKFLSGTIEGWQYALAHREEATDIVMARSSSLNRNLQRRMLDIVAEYLNLRPGAELMLDAKVWESMETLLRNQGLIRQPVPTALLTEGNTVPRAP